VPPPLRALMKERGAEAWPQAQAILKAGGSISSRPL
jgi:hypothetical protein